jgi:glycolate oxidase FAD binding subunit
VTEGGSGLDARVSPPTAEEAARVLELSSREGWRVVPIGAGTWPDGSASLKGDRTVIGVSTHRMKRTVEYEPADLTLTVEAGLTLGEVQEQAARHGQWLPMDPAPGDRGTIGAMLATGSSGPLAHAVGGPRDLTLGIELVTGDGRVLPLGGRVVKNVAGFDLVRVTVGSWGAFGVITSATLRLFPRPEVDALLVLEDQELQCLDGAAREVVGLPVEPGGVQVWTSREGEGVSVRILGSREEVDEVVDLVESRVQGSWIRVEEEEAAEWRAGIRSARSARGLGVRMALLPSRVVDLRDQTARLANDLERAEWRAAGAVFNAQTGVLDASFVPAGGVPTAPSTATVDAISAARDRLERLHGSLRLTHAPEAVRSQAAAWGSPSDVDTLTRGILDVFDPKGVMPGERFGR